MKHYTSVKIVVLGAAGAKSGILQGRRSVGFTSGRMFLIYLCIPNHPGGSHLLPWIPK